MKLCALATTLILVASCCSPLCAGIQIGDQIRLGDGIGFPGGIFNVDVLNKPQAFEPNFDTFCVELTEHVDFVNTFVVSNIGITTINGGKTLQPFGAWLYDRFRRGTLPSFSAGNPHDVNTLQLGIWLDIGYTQTDIETHVNPVAPNFYAFYNNQLTLKPWVAAYNFDVANSLWSGIGSVRIMSLKNLVNQNAQDQLFLVPEPFSFLIWSLAIAGVVGAWRYTTLKSGVTAST